MKSWRLSLFTFSFPVLAYALPTQAAEVAACTEAKSISCPQSGNFGTYSSCLSNKKSKLDNCLDGMNAQTNAAKSRVMDRINRAANAKSATLDGDQNQLQFHLAELEKINRENAARLAVLRDRFAAFSGEFEKTFKPAVLAFGLPYTQFGKDVNAVVTANSYENRPELQKIEVRANSVYAQHMATLVSMRSKVILIREEFAFFSEDYVHRVQEHLPFLKDQGYGDLAFDVAPYQALLVRADDAVIKAIDQVNQAHDGIIHRIQTTNSDLVDQYVFSKTQKVIDDTNFSLAATGFLSQVNASIKKAFVDLKSTSSQGVPLFSARFTAMNDFITFAKICEVPDTAAWMKTGCSFAIERLAAARNSLKQMPSNMQLGLSLASSKANAGQKLQIDTIKNLLNTAQINRAVVAYDALVREVFP